MIVWFFHKLRIKQLSYTFAIFECIGNSYTYTLNKFSFFFYMSTQEEEGGEIRTSDLCFMRRGPQPIKLLFENLISLVLIE
jgi:hypothetical protein